MRCVWFGQAWGSFKARRGVRRWIVEDWPVPIKGRVLGSILEGDLKLEVDA
jgi:hypothetical protein